MRFGTPLRYPGGKGRLTSYMQKVILSNNLSEGKYIEPFAGGAGLAINLLLNGSIDSIVLNDADRSIFCFWKCVLDKSEEFVEQIKHTEITVNEWDYQRSIQDNKDNASVFDLGFSTFFLNRTNRSGIISGGIIGGRNQKGKYKIDARFNKTDLCNRISKIAQYSDKISISCEDGCKFINDLNNNPDVGDVLIYIDPPYYKKGSLLYLNYYTPEDHLNLSEVIKRTDYPWILSYDDTPEIKEIYNWAKPLEFNMYYSTYAPRNGHELFYISDNISRPDVEIKPSRSDSGFIIVD